MSLFQAATPLSAAFQFFLRDFAGMLGGILFALAQARSPARPAQVLGSTHVAGPGPAACQQGFPCSMALDLCVML